MKRIVSMNALLFGLACFTGCTSTCGKVFEVFEGPPDPCVRREPNPWPWRSSAQGMWGEDPKLTPNFCFDQERRAPKMPDADRYMEKLWESHGTAIKDGLLICHVETYSHNGHESNIYRYKLDPPNPKRMHCRDDWDTFGSPDVLLRFRFRDEYPISLYGPEDHWGFFISIPHVRLGLQDPLSVRLWDRDTSSDEYMGEASVQFDGNLPVTLRSEYFTIRCNGIESDQALLRAQWWLDQLDETLARAQAYRPDPQVIDFGVNGALDHVGWNYGSGNFRYAAGFIGWEHPEIQKRLTLRQELFARDQKARAELVAKLAQSAPPAVGVHRLSEQLGAIEIFDVACKEEHCTVQARTTGDLAHELCANASAPKHVLVTSVDESGQAFGARIELKHNDAWEECTAATQIAGNSEVRFTMHDPTYLLRLQRSDEKALFLKMPAQVKSPKK